MYNTNAGERWFVPEIELVLLLMVAIIRVVYNNNTLILFSEANKAITRIYTIIQQNLSI